MQHNLKTSPSLKNKAHVISTTELKRTLRRGKSGPRRTSRIYEEYALSSSTGYDWDEASEIADIINSLSIEN